MDSAKIWILILGMAAVTYIPRALPAVLVEKLAFGPKMEKFLRLIPYTALSALIFPGVLKADPTNPAIGIVGGLVAGLLAWKRRSVMECVLAAIAAVFVMYYCLGQFA